MSNTLEIIIREVKKLTENFLKYPNPLDKILIPCDRFLSLGEFARLDKIMEELTSAFHSIEEYATKLKNLIMEASKYVDKK